MVSNLPVRTHQRPGPVERPVGPAERPVTAPQPREAEPTVPSWGVVQRGPFAAPSPQVSEELYARVVRGTALRRRHQLELRPHTTVSTDTYFGRFPACYWQRWTEVDQVRLEAVVSGSARLALMASTPEGTARTVAVQRVTGVERARVVLTTRLDRFLDGGALWLQADTEVESALVEQVRWLVPAPRRQRRTAVVICAHHPEGCLATVSSLAADREALEKVDEVYVVDQGADPVRDQDFTEVAAVLGAKLHHLHQVDLGGAGGFSRGLYEIGERPGHTDALLLADDVLVDPETVVRMTAFAAHAVEPLIVGGQLLSLGQPDRSRVDTEYADLDRLAPGPVSRDGLHRNDPVAPAPAERGDRHRRVDVDHAGWWACLVPAEVVADCGLPLPLFSEWKDIEYGIRAHRRGYATVSLPGAGVWHADVRRKDQDDWHRYFTLRNALITAALHGPFRVRSIALTTLKQLVVYLVGMQYGLAATLIRAIEDFLSGPEILDDGGVAAATEIRRLRAAYPETVRYPATALPRLRASEPLIVPADPPPSMPIAVLAKRLLCQLAGIHRQQVAWVPAREAYWWHVSLFRTVVVTDASQEGARVRHHDRTLLVRLGQRGVMACLRLVREGREVARRYRRALPELSSRHNWHRLFDVD